MVENQPQQIRFKTPGEEQYISCVSVDVGFSAGGWGKTAI